MPNYHFLFCLQIMQLRDRLSENLRNFQNKFFFSFCQGHSLKFTLQLGMEKKLYAKEKYV